MNQEGDQSYSQTPANSRKRAAEDTVSPSDGSQGDHVNSPHPLRRKPSISDLPTSLNNESTVQVQGKTYSLGELVKSAVCSREVLESISDAITPSLTKVFEVIVQPLNKKVELNSADISVMQKTIDSQNSKINELKKENRYLRTRLEEAEERFENLEKNMDNLEQYGRRTSLRFHRVTLPTNVNQSTSEQTQETQDVSDTQRSTLESSQAKIKPGLKKSLNTDQIVVDLCKKMQIEPPITEQDIFRSHTLGPVKNGKVQIICKFKDWKLKNKVFMSKSKLKVHKSSEFNVFITEDLTKKRQFMVQQLDNARRQGKIDSFWTYDGRIYYKITSTGKVKLLRNVCDIDFLFPDQSDSADDTPINNAWDNEHVGTTGGACGSDINID